MNEYKDVKSLLSKSDQIVLRSLSGLASTNPNWMDGAGFAHFLEIGCFHGHSTLNLLYHLQPKRKLYVMEIAKEYIEIASKNVKKYFPNKKVEFLHVELPSPEKQGEAIKHLGDEGGNGWIQKRYDKYFSQLPEKLKLSLAFIDNDHSYENTRHPWENLWPSIIPGGFMGFHDYEHPNYPGVTQFINELIESKRKDVIFMGRYGGIFIIQKNQKFSPKTNKS